MASNCTPGKFPSDVLLWNNEENSVNTMSDERESVRLIDQVMHRILGFVKFTRLNATMRDYILVTMCENMLKLYGGGIIISV